MIVALDILPRNEKESAEELRNAGSVPAVFYGPKEAATPIAVNARKLEALWKSAGETTLITLNGVGEAKDTLIHDVQTHPVTGQLLHVDFYVIEKGKKVTINVPLEFTGTAPAEKAGHIIVKALHEVEIEVAPQELPHSLEIDLSKLANVGDHISASEIALPPSATLLTGADEIVASVTEFKEEKVEEPAAPVAEGEAPEMAETDAAAAETPEEEKKAE